MERNLIKNQLIDILCKEFQAVWLIKIEDMSLELYTSDITKILPDSVDKAISINNYEDARKWYIENYVVQHSKSRLLEQTKMDYILHKLEGNDEFFIEYGRNNNGKINFNQLCYDKINNPDTDEIEYVVMGFRDIDVTKNSEIDDLTGLLSRGAFFKEARQILSNNPDKHYDIVLSDIIDFKKINETYGADVADELLRWVGSYLLSKKTGNTIVGRYGGDQMVVFGERESVMEYISPKDKESFKKAVRENGLPHIHVKLGVFLDVDHDMSILSMCDKAHMALNSVKHHYNKDIAYYNDEIKNHLDKQRRIEESMHDSLENGDFSVYYQPKHDAKTGKLVGAEALIRWIHPEYGFMSPADFIPLFERNGFIVENDRYVLKRTCENLRRWEDNGIETVPISVNGSKLTMKNIDLVDNVKAAIESNSLSPDKIHIEITETIMEDTTVEMVKRLNELRELGVKVELDDFGSGYSSLNVLSELPIDVLKLDMSFLQQFGDEKRTMVLESCIELAKKLGFITVSEGVELKEQQLLLEKLGVDMIQGYYYSKPLPENEFEIYMMQNM